MYFQLVTQRLCLAVLVLTRVSCFQGSVNSKGRTAAVEQIQSLAIKPEILVLKPNEEQNFTVEALLSNGSKLDATALGLWEVFEGNDFAAVSDVEGSKGLVHGIAEGTAKVRFTYGSVSIEATVTVLAPDLLSLTVSPEDESVPVGMSQQFSATGTYSNGATKDLTSLLSWSTSSNGSKAIIESGKPGLIKGVSPGADQVIATSERGISGSAQVMISDAVLKEILITVGQLESRIGSSQLFLGEGIFSDGSSRSMTEELDWSSSNTAVITVSSNAGSKGQGLIKGSGTAEIMAKYGDISAKITVTVPNTPIQTLDIVPNTPSVPKGFSRRLSLLATYSDGVVLDLSSAGSWLTDPGIDSDGTVSDVSGTKGLFIADGTTDGSDNGSAVVRASIPGITELVASETVTVNSATLTSITIDPSTLTLPVGVAKTLVAIGTFSNDMTLDISAEVSWSSSNAGVASVGASSGIKGKLTGLSVGATTITAQHGAISGTASVTVSPAEIVAIELLPDSPSVPKGFAVAFRAQARLSDNSLVDVTESAQWVSSHPLIATVQSAAPNFGRAQAVSLGTTQISAELDGVKGVSPLHVTDAVLLSLSITPNSATKYIGETLQFSATGLFSDSTELDLTSAVTWTSSQSAVASIENSSGQQGLARGILAGNTTVGASLLGKSASASLTIQNGLILVGPNGGESYFISQDIPITWQALALSGMVNLYVSTDSGGSWTLIDDDIAAGDESFTWTGSKASFLGSNLRIKIESDADPSIFDTSDANFSVVPSTLTYSGTSFLEASANNGSIVTTRTITIAGDTWINASFVEDTHYTIANVPAGLTFVLTRNSATELGLSFTGNAAAHAAANNVSNISLNLPLAAFSSGTATANNNPKTLSISFDDPATLTYSGTSFSEASTNNGSITQTRTITIAGDTWANATFNAGDEYAVNNVPNGLTLAVSRDSATQLTLSFTGSASAHANANDASNISLAFNPAAFTTGTATTNNNPKTLSVDFDDPATLTYSGTSFAEAVANNGSITATQTITISGDTWTAGPFNSGDEYGISNVPSGLTFAVTRTSATVLTLSFTGNAAAHANANDASNLSLTLNAAAFTSTTQASSNNPQTLSINFNDPATLTYSGTSFIEAADNDGSITATRTVTLSNDTWTAGPFNSGDEFGVTNVPSGLTLAIARTSATVLTLSFTGNAAAHANANDVSNISLTFNAAAFASTTQSSDNNPKTLSIDFADAATISYSSTTFVEAGTNDGSITQSITATLSNGTFDNDGSFNVGDEYSISYSPTTPTGLTLVVTRDSNTQLTLSWTGAASAHTNSADTSVTVTWNAAAFASGGLPSVGQDQALAIDFSTQALVLTFPVGGENVLLNTATTITWTSSLGSGNVQIEISENGGSSWSNLAASTSDDGSHAWTPTVASDTVRIRVTHLDEAGLSSASGSNVRVIQPADIASVITSTSPTVATTGVQDGDLIFLSWALKETVTVPSGYTVLQHVVQHLNSASQIRQGVAYKVAASEPSSYTLASASSNGWGDAVTLTVVRNYGSATPLAYQTQNYTASDWSGSPITWSSITTGQSQSLLILIAITNNGCTNSASPTPSGFTLRGQAWSPHSNPLNYKAVQVFSKQLTTSSSGAVEQATTSYCDGSSVGESGVLFAIKHDI